MPPRKQSTSKAPRTKRAHRQEERKARPVARTHKKQVALRDVKALSRREHASLVRDMGNLVKSAGVGSNPLRGDPRGRPTSVGFGRPGPKGRVIHGTEFIGTVTMGTNNTAGAILFNVQNRINTLGSRLSHVAAMFQRWHCIRYTYRFISSVSKNQAGTLIHAQDPDPCVAWTTSPETLSRLSAASGSRIRQVHEDVDVPLASSADYTSLWCVDTDTKTVTDSDRLTTAGQYVIAIAAPLTSLGAGAAVGIVELDYEIEFYVDRLSPSGLTRQSTVEMKLPTATIREAFKNGMAASVMDTMQNHPSWNNLPYDVLDVAKTAARSYLGGKIPSVIPADEKTEAKGMLGGFVPSGYGFKTGSYMFQYLIYSSDAATTGTDVATWITSSQWTRTGGATLASSVYQPLTYSAGMVLPSGVTRPGWSGLAAFDMAPGPAVDFALGLSDLAVVWNNAASGIGNCVLMCIITAAATYQYATGSVSMDAPRVRMVTATCADRTGGLPVPARPSRPLLSDFMRGADVDDDLEDLSPPRLERQRARDHLYEPSSSDRKADLVLRSPLPPPGGVPPAAAVARTPR